LLSLRKDEKHDLGAGHVLFVPLLGRSFWMSLAYNSLAVQEPCRPNIMINFW
jgi:hypothetical protein